MLFRSFVYDAAGRLTNESAPFGQSSKPLKALIYDVAPNGGGKLASASAYNWRSADSCSVRFEVRQDLSYDPSHGRLSQETTTLLHGSALEKWTQGYAYDGAGRVTTTTYPSCLTLCPATPRAVTTNYAFGRPTSVPGFASPISYNHNGTLASITHQNGVFFTETADPTGMPRPQALGIQSGIQGSANPWPPESYSYDAAGNVTQIGAKSFVYDADSRLISAALPPAGAQPYPQPYQEYTYDAFNNLVKIARGTGPGNTPSSTTYDTYLTSNHLTGGMYNGAGSLTDYQSSHYLWDPLEQLTDVDTGSETWVHTYDAAGERVWSWRTSSSRIDNYALRGQDGKVLSLFTKSGAAYTWEDYVYREGQLLGAQFSTGTVHHFDVDHLGSVRLETDGSGQVQSYRDLWPFGDEATPPTSGERMRFTGHERDLGVLTSTADDIDYMHARYYRPLFARFLSVDPAEGDPAEPQSWNRYSYVRSHPLTATDPTGLWTVLLGNSSGCFTDDCIDVTTSPWQFAPGANTGLWGLGSLLVGSAEFLSGYNEGGDPTVPERSPAPEPKKADERKCASWWTNTKRRFTITNHSFPGRLAPIGTGFITSRAFAAANGFMSPVQWARSGFGGMSLGAFELTAAETAGAVAVTSAANWLLVGVVFQGGVAVGSGLGALVDEALTGGCGAP